MRTHRLVLAKETLTELRSEDLLNVVGGPYAITPAPKCVTNLGTCHSLFEYCVSTSV
jgi:hypothetical protein